MKKKGRRTGVPYVWMVCGAVVLTVIVVAAGVRDVNDPSVSETRRFYAERELRIFYVFPVAGALIGYFVSRLWKLVDDVTAGPKGATKRVTVAPGAARALSEGESAGVLLTETSAGDYYYSLSAEDVGVAREAFEWRSFDMVRDGLRKRDPSDIYLNAFDPDAEEPSDEAKSVVEVVRKAAKDSLSAAEQKQLAAYDAANAALFWWFGTPIDAPEDSCDGYVRAARPESARGMLAMLAEGSLGPAGQQMLGAWIARNEPELSEGLVAIAARPERRDAVHRVLESVIARGERPARFIAGAWIIESARRVGMGEAASTWMG